MIRRYGRFLTVAASLALLSGGGLAQAPSMTLVPAGTETGLPAVRSNDNTVPAGAWRDGVREIDLTVLEADWRIESPRGPGLRVAAVAEGGVPMVPAPLIRVETGTRVRVHVRNALADVPIRVYGLHRRPLEGAEPLVLEPGERRTVEFEAGEAGTYMYWMEKGREPEPDPEAVLPEGTQLAGALVVDPVGGSPADRILVINIFSEPIDASDPEGDWLEALTINGLSWPFTERMQLAVGEHVRWRVVNASDRNHPMHLHGFYFSVRARGTAAGDTLYAERDWRSVVTEPMLGKTTMLMEWTPSRPGRWLFHCHLSFHVTAHIRLPGAAEASPELGHVHMAGLAVGIEVAPGPSDLVAVGEPVQVDLHANEYGDVPGYRYGFSRTADARPDSLTEAPGPMLVFNQYQAVDATVHNNLSVPTGVHWHGLELDAWADGVPDWSASDGKVSPVIAPGESFTYRLSLLRPGTFIYHSHLDDIVQLTGGLYGPLIVLPPGETFDPERDHVLTWGWNTPDSGVLADLDLNGRRDQPGQETRVGVRHRFRLINIAPAGMLTAWLTRDGVTVPITLLAKDGADLPPHQQVAVDQLPRLGVGETADFTWTPSEPGTYELRVGYAPDASFAQTWVVTAGGS